MSKATAFADKAMGLCRILAMAATLSILAKAELRSADDLDLSQHVV